MKERQAILIRVEEIHARLLVLRASDYSPEALGEAIRLSVELDTLRWVLS